MNIINKKIRIENMYNGIFMAFCGTMFTFLVTALGALNVFWIKEIGNTVYRRAFLGFAGGVMVAASIWSLIIPGIEMANENNQISWLMISAGFLAGVVFLLLADKVLERRYLRTKINKKDIRLNRNTIMLVLAMTVHNIPEGMAVGLAFALAAAEPGNVALTSGAVALAIGIGIQNYPEGTAVSLPLVAEGVSKKKAFLIGVLSAAVEPIAAVLAAILAGFVTVIIPGFLAFAAGTMIYVVVEELIPQAHMGEKDNIGTLGFVTGFVIMMILDVTLG